jgi:hypothetical protein
MGVQFFHVNAYSMGGKNPVSGCLGEAFRLGDQYTTHIENPKPPTPLFGSLEAINSALKSYIQLTKDKRAHSLRKDARSLLAGVYSLPPGTTMSEYQKALPDLIAALHKRYRGNLRAIVPHYDEPYKTGGYAGKTHYHVHFYAVAEPPGTFLDLHPGYKAKRDADRHTRASSPEDKKKYARLGNLAYKAAMAKEQDWWYQEVGKKIGLDRLGLDEGRLSRRAKKRLEAAAAEAGETLDKARQEAARIREEARRMKEAAATGETALKKKEEAFNAGKDTVLKKWGMPGFYDDEKITSGILKKETAGFKHSYFDRVYSWAAGLVQRASRVISEYTAKKKELDQQLEIQKKITAEKGHELARLQGKYGDAKEFAEWQAERNRRRAGNIRSRNDPELGR